VSVITELSWREGGVVVGMFFGEIDWWPQSVLRPSPFALRGAEDETGYEGRERRKEGGQKWDRSLMVWFCVLLRRSREMVE